MKAKQTRRTVFDRLRDSSKAGESAASCVVVPVPGGGSWRILEGVCQLVNPSFWWFEDDIDVWFEEVCGFVNPYIDVCHCLTVRNPELYVMEI